VQWSWFYLHLGGHTCTLEATDSNLLPLVLLLSPESSADCPPGFRTSPTSTSSSLLISMGSYMRTEDL